MQAFFQKTSENDILITSTSANHIANVAKEHIETLKSKIDSFQFYMSTISLLGSGESTTLSNGNITNLRDVENILSQISKYTTLIAYLREAIKAKDFMIAEIRTTHFADFCRDNGLSTSETPRLEPTLTEEEYYNSLPIKERTQYYMLETKAAVIGKYIHPNGTFAKARAELQNILNNPRESEGSGRDTTIINYSPVASVEQIDSQFFTLQALHREAQASLNGMKQKCKEAIDEDALEKLQKYNQALEVYNKKREELRVKYEEVTSFKLKEYSELKIVIPHALVEEYNFINSLGK
nr:MAG TPA: hypothetical protein [Crassvirales sp.]